MSIKNALRNFLYEAKFLVGCALYVLTYATILLALVYGGIKLFHKNDILASSAMITNLDHTSGGSGIILISSEKESLVLTNAHVCKVAKNGGFVSNNDGKSFLVHSYKASAVDDLCLIKVLGDLGAYTTIASHPPVPFYEKASISGHPSLLPTVVTTGHFSGKQSIQVMTGLKPCTKEDEGSMNGMGALICLILGGMPTFTQYDTILVTATIMPGSSGSGVFNSRNELAGVVFAGNGDLGYASTIPYENMMHFLDSEVQGLAEQFPSDKLTILGTPAQPEIYKLKKVCHGPLGHFFKDVCEIMEKDAIWRK